MTNEKSAPGEVPPSPDRIERIWTCKIGGIVGDLPQAADWPMREAAQNAFRLVTGHNCEFTFSGWGGTLEESERAFVEDREPRKTAVQRPSDDFPATRTERHLRRMLCVAHCGATAYMDDGEASDSSVHPSIDFMRDTPERIRDLLRERGRERLERAWEAARLALAVEAVAVPPEQPARVNCEVECVHECQRSTMGFCNQPPLPRKAEQPALPDCCTSGVGDCENFPCNLGPDEEQPALTDEREAFLVWWDQAGAGNYHSSAWAGWQARAVLAGQARQP